MEFPSSFLQSLNTSGGPRSEWEEQLDRFLARLNPERTKAGYKPYTHAHLAKLLKNANVHDAAGAYRFYRTCERADNFGRLFAHLTKTRP
jgi:GH25 family lysozyme M1 (1,4-beta-N-acetylmuramidase)